MAWIVFLTTISDKLLMTRNKVADLKKYSNMKKTTVLQKIYADEIFDIIRQLKSKNSSHLFNLSSGLLRAVNPAKWELLASNFNKYVQKYTNPNFWKQQKYFYFPN